MLARSLSFMLGRVSLIRFPVQKSTSSVPGSLMHSLTDLVHFQSRQFIARTIHVMLTDAFERMCAFA